MSVYAEVGQNLQQIGGELPEGWIVMREVRPLTDNWWSLVASLDGEWVVSEELVRNAARKVEDEWRAIEMAIARENVTAIEFGDDSISGRAAQWKAYWLALRAWVEGAKGYPDSTHRPVEPT